jgi:integrase
MNQLIESDLRHLATAPDALRQTFALMAYGLTETSKRQYAHTFRRWLDWCGDVGIPAQDLSATHVIAFLGSTDLARRSKQARLSHLRRLAQTLHSADIGNPRYEQNHQQLQLLKLPKDDRAGQTRERKALAPDQVYEALQHWPQKTNMGRRNRALLAVLFYAGLRRSEAVDLQWRDIDFDQGLLTVRHGKGNKERTIPFASDKALNILQLWRDCVPDYEYVFVAVNKGDNIQQDIPISTETVRRVCLQSGTSNRMMPGEP